MARQRISEFRAKKLLFETLGIKYDGLSINNTQKSKEELKTLHKGRYVIKVDSGIKKRMKMGLVAIDKTNEQLLSEWEKLVKMGYRQFLVEKFISHNSSEEKFIAIERTRNGLLLLYSNKGGIDIESNQDKVKKDFLRNGSLLKISRFLGLPTDMLHGITKTFEQFYLSFLEMNPFIVTTKGFFPLDMAVEVDTAAQFFVNDSWKDADFVNPGTKIKTQEEKEVDNLNRKSQASFKLDILNKDGSIFMLLSGGGASLILADEVYNLGFGKELANYGEYSGNPNEEETYLYARNVLSLLVDSCSKRKILIIGGGVANFTDIRITFNGIIKALEEIKNKLKNKSVKIFVRRGGPHQEDALYSIEQFLQDNDLLGRVDRPERVLTHIVKEGLAYLKS